MMRLSRGNTITPLGSKTFHAWPQTLALPYPYLTHSPTPSHVSHSPILHLAHNKPAINVCWIKAIGMQVGGLRKMCHGSAFQVKHRDSEPKPGEARYFWMALNKYVGFLFVEKCHCISFLVSFSCLGWGGLRNQSLTVSHPLLSCQTIHNC